MYNASGEYPKMERTQAYTNIDTAAGPRLFKAFNYFLWLTKDKSRWIDSHYFWDGHCNCCHAWIMMMIPIVVIHTTLHQRMRILVRMRVIPLNLRINKRTRDWSQRIFCILRLRALLIGMPNKTKATYLVVYNLVLDLGLVLGHCF